MRLIVGLWLFNALFCLSACTSGDSYITHSNQELFIPNRDKGATCIMFITPDCPLSHAYAGPFMSLRDRYDAHIEFVAAMPGRLYSSQELQQYLDSFHFDIPVVLDVNHNLVKRTDAQITPQFVLMDQNEKVHYSGAFDNWAISLARKRINPTKHYLQTAIDEWLADGTVKQKSIPAIGCHIEVN